ncbi:MAG: host attachment protein [Myxococcota bacterium]
MIPHTTTWVALADRTHARFLALQGRTLVTVRELEDVRAKQRNQDFDADRPGRAFDRVGMGRHALEREHSPTQRAAAAFAKTVAQALGAARAEGSFERLILVAEPGFLGMLRRDLDRATQSTVVATIPKALLRAEQRQLFSALADQLPLLRR